MIKYLFGIVIIIVLRQPLRPTTMALFDFFGSLNKGKGKREEEQTLYAPHHSVQEDPNKPSCKAIIYKSELDFISRCILDYKNIETGGELFGFWTQMGTPVVMYAVGPGPKAKHHPTSFIQDSDYVDNIEVELCNRTGLQHIGQWHSHHQLSLAHPSGGDVASMQRGVGLPGFPRMLLCIGNCTTSTTTINAFNFHENTPGQYVHAIWDVVAIDSPFRIMINEMFRGRLYMPRTQQASHENMRILTKGNTDTKKEYSQHWLTERVENVEMMKGFLRSAGVVFNGSLPAAEIMESGEPLISLYSGNLKIMLPYGFPRKSPFYVMIGGQECTKDCEINTQAMLVWDSIGGSLDVKFLDWMEQTQLKLLTQSEKQSTVSQFDNEASNELMSEHDRIEEEKRLLEYALPKDFFKFSRLETGCFVSEAIIVPTNPQKKIEVKVTRDAGFNFLNAEYRLLIPEIPLEECPYQPLSDLTPDALVFIKQKVSCSTTELDIYKMLSILFHQSEHSNNGVDFECILNQIMTNDEIFDNLMEQERLNLEQHKY